MRHTNFMFQLLNVATDLVRSSHNANVVEYVCRKEMISNIATLGVVVLFPTISTELPGVAAPGPELILLQPFEEFST